MPVLLIEDGDLHCGYYSKNMVGDCKTSLKFMHFSQFSKMQMRAAINHLGFKSTHQKLGQEFEDLTFLMEARLRKVDHKRKNTSMLLTVCKKLKDQMTRLKKFQSELSRQLADIDSTVHEFYVENGVIDDATPDIQSFVLSLDDKNFTGHEECVREVATQRTRHAHERKRHLQIRRSPSPLNFAQALRHSKAAPRGGLVSPPPTHTFRPVM